MVGIIEPDDRTCTEDDVACLRDLLFSSTICTEPHEYYGLYPDLHMRYCSNCKTGDVL